MAYFPLLFLAALLKEGGFLAFILANHQKRRLAKQSNSQKPGLPKKLELLKK
ncbi:hypothetical protein LMZ02_26970 [Paenibacillus macerans]|uniref:Uncharacterized protein n=2 Tax=Paenibacillus macerans TaxID=44252 RepID=A0A091A154_PAEMA|nr:hypothetical protein [Paenibacillus macerans]KFN10026.1 hypothetical protein DJ90_565 [Paenibacillus macerans]UMV47063.1 hypothetical protein LMZ02_26970 [Paenibacillus macerans]